MRVESLSLIDFRSYPTLELELGDGLTVFTGDNGQGKTNILEAVGWVGGLGSFRDAPDEALVRDGQDVAVVRLLGRADTGRELLVEAEIQKKGRSRVQVNRQRIKRMSDLVGQVPITVFSPNDLDIVKGSPSGRRQWIDAVVALQHPTYATLRPTLDKVLRQRNALLRQSGGRMTEEISITLDVWDSKLADVGDSLRTARREVLERCRPLLGEAYDSVAHQPARADANYVSSWGDESLAEALMAGRQQDLRRGVSLVGPHRDDVDLSIGGLPARSHASQGEQRSMALALRLAADALLRSVGPERPVLLLDDVFSELDPDRSAALLKALPEGQQLLTTASPLPPGATPAQVVDVRRGSAIARSVSQ